MTDTQHLSSFVAQLRHYTESQKMRQFALFSVSGLKDENLIKKQIYTKTEAYKLCSRYF